MKPVAVARITQPFADPGSYASQSDRHGPAGHHTGTDWGTDWEKDSDGINGNAVRSVLAGTVVISDYNSTMGNWVGVYNAKRNVTYTYWHMGNRNVWLGQHIEKGHVIGKVGDTGNSTAPHLHVQANPGKGFDYHAHKKPSAAYGLPWPKIRNKRLVFGDRHGEIVHSHADGGVGNPQDYDGAGRLA